MSRVFELILDVYRACPMRSLRTIMAPRLRAAGVTASVTASRRLAGPSRVVTGHDQYCTSASSVMQLNAYSRQLRSRNGGLKPEVGGFDPALGEESYLPAEMAVEGLIAPQIAIGLPQFTVASMKNAVSSSVSVPTEDKVSSAMFRSRLQLTMSDDESVGGRILSAKKLVG